MYFMLCHYLESGTQLSHSPLPELSLFGDVMIFAIHYEIISRNILSTLRNSGNSGAIKIISNKTDFSIGHYLHDQSERFDNSNNSPGVDM